MEKRRLFENVDEESDLFVDLSTELWELAEPSLEETQSAALLADALDEEGFEVRRAVSGIPTAFVARYGSESPMIGTIGEYDALPGLSQKVKSEVDPVEEGGPGHGCGHNLFGPASLIGAISAKRAIERGNTDGSVVYFGCPAEEILVGKPYMITDGVFDDVDAVVTWHPGRLNTPRLESCTALKSFVVTFEGTASHAGAAPESGRSALDGVQLLNTGVEHIREHVVDDARINYVIADGGNSPGVVPANASAWYNVSAPGKDAVEFITEWIEDAAEGAAAMTRTGVDVTHLTGTYGFLPNETISDVILENMQEIGPISYSEEERALATELQETVGADVVRSQMKQYHVPDSLLDEITDTSLYGTPVPPFDAGEVGAFSSDTGNVSHVVPLGRFKAATWPIGTPGHSWQAVAASGSGFGQKGGLFAAKVIAGTMFDLFTSEELLRAATEEFEASNGDQGYESPVPVDRTPPIDVFKNLH